MKQVQLKLTIEIQAEDGFEAHLIALQNATAEVAAAFFGLAEGEKLVVESWKVLGDVAEE